VRQWRALIAFRQQLVRRRGRIKNHIRDLLVSEGQLLPRGSSCWTQLGIAQLEALARPLHEVSMSELWRGQLAIELREVQQEIAAAEEKLDAIVSRKRSCRSTSRAFTRMNTCSERFSLT
ncbi:MAG TPA: hypothetical protein VJM50_08085, partial [Pyrinomonadaceae bacterium]|nr:hypothetical protein [Pyrinomonadaceae bacterium]